MAMYDLAQHEAVILGAEISGGGRDLVGLRMAAEEAGHHSRDHGMPLGIAEGCAVQPGLDEPGREDVEQDACAAPIRRNRLRAAPARKCGLLLSRASIRPTWIRIPGQSAPVTIADTHLNSRKASGTPSTRANAAFIKQWAEARRFIAAHVNTRTSLIFGGDFNIGHDPARTVHTDRAAVSGIQEATAMLATTMPARSLDADVRAVIDRGKDKQFFRSGSGERLAPRKVEVPFGIGEGGYHLSDHLGFVVTYDTSPQGGTT